MKLIRFSISFCILSFALFFLSACADEKGEQAVPEDNFDRKEMLIFWADNYILPAYENYDEKVKNLVASKDAFVADNSMDNFTKLKSSWLEAYQAWQSISMFEIGPAESIGYRNFVNIFPCDTVLVNENIRLANYNLTLPSNFDAQGYPALDYLLYGLNETDEDNRLALSQTQYSNYLADVVNRLAELHTQVLIEWQTTYRDQFVNNSGASATASTDKMVNDFLFYYEKFFRAGKIGIPAGVFSGSPISQTVEAPYSGVYSKALFDAAFDGLQRFFIGQSFDGSQSGPSLKQYLDYFNDDNEVSTLSQSITDQWKIAEAAVVNLQDNFKNQVEDDNTKMLQAYDEIQKATVLLKVDMMQTLNIQVDYVDADGD